MSSNPDSEKSGIHLGNDFSDNPVKESHGVTIHTPPDKLGEFILNLLSKPQTMKRLFLGAYKANLNNILDIHHKIDQCIVFDRKGILVNFTVEVIFENNSSITVNSIEEFSTYRFPDSSIPIRCTLNWTYLVKFDHDSTPEKQSIEVLFNSGEVHIFSIKEGVNNLDYLLSGVIKMEIECTNRILGRTIETEVSSIIENIITPVSNIKKTILDYSDPIETIISMIFSFISLWIGYSYAMDVLQNISFTMNDIYINIVNYITFIVIAILISRGLATWILNSYGAGWKYYTFLMLNEASEKYYKKIEKKKKISSISFGISVLVTIITGIVANYMFQYLTTN